MISDKKFLTAAASILAVEPYHMGMARSTLYRMGGEARDAANKLSDARDTLDGPDDLDQGIGPAARRTSCRPTPMEKRSRARRSRR